MLKHLEKLTGFSRKHFETRAITDEFNHKYSDTWLLINNKLTYIKLYDHVKQAFIYFDGKTQKQEYFVLNIQDIQPWRPSAGWYYCKDPSSFVFLQKTALKTYKKSFSADSNYTAVNIYNEPCSFKELENLTEEQDFSQGFISENRQFLIDKRNIYLNNTPIADYQILPDLINQNVKLQIKTPIIFGKEIFQFINKELKI